MKNLFFIFLLSVIIYGCSKQSTPAPPIVKTWIMGKWKRVSYVDTNFYNDGTKGIFRNGTANELDFVSQPNFPTSSLYVTETSNPGPQYTYSLQDMTINLPTGNGTPLTINKISDTHIILVYWYLTNVDRTVPGNVFKVWWNDEYIKE